MKFRIRNILYSLVIVALFHWGCSDELKVIYQPLDSIDYVFFKEVPMNDTVILILPDDLTHDINPDNDLEEKLTFFPYNVVLVHQAQTKDPNLSKQYYMTTEEAHAINEVSIDILNRTIGSFKTEGMYVVVFGDYVGSFLALRSIARDGLIADRYVLLNGRLDVEEELVRVAEELKVAILDGADILLNGFVIHKENWVDYRLLGNLAKPKYTNELSDFDLARMLYTFRQENDDLGPLQAEEVDFLISRGASVISFPGSQDWSGYEYYALLDFIRL